MPSAERTNFSGLHIKAICGRWPTMLLVNGAATIAACEQYLDAMNRAPAQARILKLAHNLRYGQCGGLAALVQVIATWARANPEPSLHPYISGVDPAAVLEAMVATPAGLAAVLLAKEIGPENALRSQAYAAARGQVRIMHDGPLRETAKGPRVSLLCADHSSLRALRPLYRPSADGVGRIRSEVEFKDLADELLEIVLAGRRRDLHFGASELGALIRELFANTHDHARADASGVPYSKSVRGLYLGHHLVRAENVDSIAGDYAPLARFLDDSRGRTASVTSQFFEISVYDTGPGWAARVLGGSVEDVPIEREYEAILRCLDDGFTTTGIFGRGMGLPRIMKRLKQHQGFIRLRTGRLSLSRSFAGARGPLTPQDRLLGDATTGGRPRETRAVAAGTLITLLIPLRVKPV